MVVAQVRGGLRLFRFNVVRVLPALMGAALSGGASGCTIDLPGDGLGSGRDLSGDTVMLEPPPEGIASVEEAQASAPIMVFLNFDGGPLNCGYDDSRTNTSQIICNLTYPAFNPAGFGCGSVAECKAALTAASQDQWAEWNIVFTSTRPASGNYEMVMIGGAVGGGAAGVAPLDCFGGANGNPNNVSFAFSDVVAGGFCAFEEVLTTIAQELSHALGMCHNDNAGSIMYPAIASCDPTWACGSQIDTCECTGLGYDPYCPMTAFDSILGAAEDLWPPIVSFTGPTNGASVATTFDVTVEATDDRQVDEVYLYVGGTLWGMLAAPPYSWTVTAASGTVELAAYAWDSFDNQGSSTINVAVVDPGDLGAVGDDCTSNGECASNICAARGEERRCTATCTTPADCPASFTCDAAGSVNVCWPPEGYDPNPRGCACEVVGAGTSEGGASGALAGGLALLALGAVLLRRRACGGARSSSRG